MLSLIGEKYASVFLRLVIQTKWKKKMNELKEEDSYQQIVASSVLKGVSLRFC